jgi:hypothetical protein
VHWFINYLITFCSIIKYLNTWYIRLEITSFITKIHTSILPYLVTTISIVIMFNTCKIRSWITSWLTEIQALGIVISLQIYIRNIWSISTYSRPRSSIITLIFRFICTKFYSRFTILINSWNFCNIWYIFTGIWTNLIYCRLIFTSRI